MEAAGLPLAADHDVCDFGELGWVGGFGVGFAEGAEGGGGEEVLVYALGMVDVVAR